MNSAFGPKRGGRQTLLRGGGINSEKGTETLVLYVYGTIHV